MAELEVKWAADFVSKLAHFCSCARGFTPFGQTWGLGSTEIEAHPAEGRRAGQAPKSVIARLPLLANGLAVLRPATWMRCQARFPTELLMAIAERPAVRQLLVALNGGRTVPRPQ